MILAEETDLRLRAAGITGDDPGLQHLRRWNAAAYARAGRTCATMPDSAWLARFPGRCYFYPGRDCPGWQRGQPCGRIGEVVPGADQP